jgi:hypothetical protein
MNDRTPTEPTWKTVPTEATTAQLKAGQDAWHNDPLRLSSTLYRAMVAASPPAPAAEVEPVAWIPASQIDELRELAGGIDLEYWSTKVIHAYVLPAEGRIPVYLSPPTTDAIRAQARREALEEAAKEMDRRRDDATGICSPRVTYSNAARAIRALADKGEAE